MFSPSSCFDPVTDGDGTAPPFRPPTHSSSDFMIYVFCTRSFLFLDRGKERLTQVCCDLLVHRFHAVLHHAIRQQPSLFFPSPPLRLACFDSLITTARVSIRGSRGEFKSAGLVYKHHASPMRLRRQPEQPRLGVNPSGLLFLSNVKTAQTIPPPPLARGTRIPR